MSIKNGHGFPYQLYLFVGGAYLLNLLVISQYRITVYSDSIAFRSGFGRMRRIPFGTIDHSQKVVLAEPKYPVALRLTLVSGNIDRTVNLRLKAFHKDDVAWLIALPQLKVR